MSASVVFPGGAEEPPPPAGTRGIVYVLVNLAMPGLIKIGRTTGRLEDRLKQLDTTGIPLPFECVHAVEVDDVAFVERHLHLAFADSRVRQNREFFRVGADRVRAALSLARGTDRTPKADVVQSSDDQVALNRERARRPVFKFTQADVPVGAILASTFDPTETCEVVDDRKVRFRGGIQSLSAAATTIAREHGYATGVSGPWYWTFQGRTLDDLRVEREERDAEAE